MKKRVLIIVDPQNDFISGSLPVLHAAEAMDRLADLLPTLELDAIVVTLDWHPADHCSFEANGGIWPAHCVRYSVGAAIWERLFQAIVAHPAKKLFLEKGADVSFDQYSAFAEQYPAVLHEHKEIWLCGIAGNVCVLTSYRDLVSKGLGDKLFLIPELSPSLDDGTALQEAIAELGGKTLSLARLEK